MRFAILLSLFVSTFAVAQSAGPAAERKTGRIEGRVFPLPQPPNLRDVKAQSVQLYTGQREKTAETAVGADGSFRFEDVPSGLVVLLPVFSVGDARGVTLPTQRIDALVYQEKTTEVGLFGKGRPVTGRVELPGGIERGRVRVSLDLVAPPFRAMRDPGRDGRPNPLPALYDRIRAGRTLESAVDRQGRFRIESVREGTYRIGAWVTGDGDTPRIAFMEKVEPGYPDVDHGRLRIYAMPGGQSDTPLDLGTLRFRRH